MNSRFIFLNAWDYIIFLRFNDYVLIESPLPQEIKMCKLHSIHVISDNFKWSIYFKVIFF